MAACRNCDRDVLWAETPSGKTIMLDEVRDLSKAVQQGEWVMMGGLRTRVVVKGKERWATAEDLKLRRPLYVCHWDTCKG